MTRSGSGRPFARVERFGRSTVTLWNEDGIGGLVRRLPAHGVDVVVTSPPYNRGAPYTRYHDRRPREEYLSWMGELATSLDRVLAPEASLFLNIGSPPRDPWLAWDVARTVAGPFVLQNVLHWVKSIAIDRRFVGRAAQIDRDLALGHYRPVGSDRFVHGAQEYIFHFTRSGRIPLDRLAIGVPYQDRSNVRRWRAATSGIRCRGNTWFLPYPTIQDRQRDRPHPATFPGELAEWCVRLHGRSKVRRMADPFVGIGSSALAALRLGITFDGFDIDRSYLEVARDRLRTERTRLKARPSRTSASGRSRSGAASTPSSAAS